MAENFFFQKGLSFVVFFSEQKFGFCFLFQSFFFERIFSKEFCFLFERGCCFSKVFSPKGLFLFQNFFFLLKVFSEGFFQGLLLKGFFFEYVSPICLLTKSFFYHIFQKFFWVEGCFKCVSFLESVFFSKFFLFKSFFFNLFFSSKGFFHMVLHPKKGFSRFFFSFFAFFFLFQGFFLSNSFPKSFSRNVSLRFFFLDFSKCVFSHSFLIKIGMCIVKEDFFQGDRASVL